MAKVAYTGPCVKCGATQSREFTKRMCVSCYKKSKYIYKEPRKYTGPCVICGISNPEFTGRFTNKMCYACRSRMRTSGNVIPRQKYTGPCIKCGTFNSRTFYQGSLCRSCYRKSAYAVKPSTFCIDCRVEMWSGRKNPRCNNCDHKYKWRNNPDYKAGFKRRAKKYQSTLKGRIVSQNHVRKRRAILSQVESTLTNEEWIHILKKFNYSCAYCGKRNTLEMDHVVPISKGGAHTVNNVVPACRKCNASKCDKLPPIPVQPLLL